MIKQIVKLILKSKGKTFLLLIELCLAFLGLIAIGVIVFGLLKNMKQPLGYEFKNVYQLNYTNLGEWSSDDVKQMNDLIRSQPEVSKLGFWHYNPPFSHQENVPGGEVKCNRQSINETINLFRADGEMGIIFNIKMLQGRWFDKTDIAAKDWPIIINVRLRDKYFKNVNPLGNMIEICGEKGKIIGVIDDFRYKGEFSESNNVIIAHQTFREKVAYNYSDCISCNGCGWDIFFFKTKFKNPRFEASLIKVLNTKFPNWAITIEPVENLHKTYKQRTWWPIALMSLVILYVLSNVLFGIFGLLWYSVSQRKPEIGLRLAMGANKKQIYKQFIGEMLVIASFGVVPGIIIAVQFSLLRIFNIDPLIYFVAILTTLVITYILITLCAIIPSALAARTQPAEALHEE